MKLLKRDQLEDDNDLIHNKVSDTEDMREGRDHALRGAHEGTTRRNVGVSLRIDFARSRG